MQNNAAAAISQTKDTKNEAHKRPKSNYLKNRAPPPPDFQVS
jgi:hypothetical protein